jgi:mono/diheme cytochrome c family protein
VKISRTSWTRIALAVVVALAALFLIRLHNARGATLPLDSAAAGHRLADAWCKECHAIEAATDDAARAAPAFAKIANLPSTTALSLKVFLHTSHPSMPNLVFTPDETDDLVNYILSLKRN